MLSAPNWARTVSDSGGTRSRRDAVSVLTVYLFVLYAVPADRTLAAIGGIGRPSILLALLLGLMWCWFHVQRPNRLEPMGHSLVRSAALGFAGMALTSYGLSALRPMSLEESNAADTGLIRLLAWVGLLLFMHDGILSRLRLRVLLERLVWAGALLATLGLAQFSLGLAIVDQVVLPGLVSDQGFSNVQERGGFVRAAATAMNPLEYAAVLGMIFPLAVTWAQVGGRTRVLRTIPAVAVSIALVLSVSRSSFLGVAVAVLVLAPGWSRRFRWQFTLAASGLMAAVYVLVPGMVGTIRGLFMSTFTDASTTSRTGSYDLVLGFVRQDLWLGRGVGTFLPQYRILDNQYLGTVIEMGLLGALALLALFISGMLGAHLPQPGPVTASDRELGRALAASVAAGATVFAFFDVFAFPMAAGTLFLVLGLAGAFARLSPPRCSPSSLPGAPRSAECDGGQ